MEAKEFKKIVSHPLFRGTDPAFLRRLSDEGGAFLRNYADGETIRSPGDEAPLAGFLLSGKASVSTCDPDRSVLLRYLGAGDPFGIANLFASEPFVSLIEASGACRCFFLTEDAVRLLLAESAPFRENYVRFLGSRIRFLNRKIGYLTAGSAERRLALYLASLGGGEVRLPIALSALSELLDVSRASLYRAFDRLESDGYLSRRGRSLVLCEPEALRRAYRL